MHFISFQYRNIAVAMAGLRNRPTTPWTIVPWLLASHAEALNEVKNDQQWQRHWNRNKTGKPYDSCMMHGLYFMLYVQWGPTKYFGPRAPQSHNPALPVASEKQNATTLWKPTEGTALPLHCHLSSDVPAFQPSATQLFQSALPSCRTLGCRTSRMSSVTVSRKQMKTLSLQLFLPQSPAVSAQWLQSFWTL